LVERDYISKINGKQQSKIWDPEKSQTKMRQQRRKLSKQQQSKVLDPRRWRIAVKKSHRRGYGCHQQ
jgi:hypothetical protein